MEKRKTPSPGREALTRSFASARLWREWLARNHGRPEGIWVRFYKKASGKKSVTHEEALEEALCQGWIDGQGRPHDEASWLVKFTPRRPKSLWSKRNREKAESLIKQRRMKAAGMREVERAKADGRWEAAYDSSRTMTVPEDFLRELRRDADAYDFFLTLNKANTYAVAWRLQTAKRPETREKRLRALLEKMKNREPLH